jgi:phosphoglycolate phosphatase
MKQIFTVLFDLDGTLVDTAPDLMRAHNHVMKKFGYPTKSTEEIRNLVGQGAGAMLGRSIWGQAKKEFGKVQNEKIKKEMVDAFMDYYGKNIINESTLINGVKEFLKWCKEKNISMAVCTNKQEHLAIDLLKKIGIYDYFEYVAGSNTFDYCKPDPRHLTNVIEILGGEIKRSIMIGDSETDANAGKNAGIPVVLLEDGYTEKNTTEIYHNHLIKDFMLVLKKLSLNILRIDYFIFAYKNLLILRSYFDQS